MLLSPGKSPGKVLEICFLKKSMKPVYNYMYVPHSAIKHNSNTNNQKRSLSY